MISAMRSCLLDSFFFEEPWGLVTVSGSLRASPDLLSEEFWLQYVAPHYLASSTAQAARAELASRFGRNPTKEQAKGHARHCSEEQFAVLLGRNHQDFVSTSNEIQWRNFTSRELLDRKRKQRQQLARDVRGKDAKRRKRQNIEDEIANRALYKSNAAQKAAQQQRAYGESTVSLGLVLAHACVRLGFSSWVSFLFLTLM